MPGPVIDEAKVARVQKLRRQGLSLAEIQAATGVSMTSVRRYTSPAYRRQHDEAVARYRERERMGRKGGRLTFQERLERFNLDRKPLYDPKRHELEPQSLTAELMGDPREGRRAIEAPEPATQQRRQPWSPQRPL